MPILQRTKPPYIKVNPKVAESLGLTKERNMTKDGNYLLWQSDLNAFGQTYTPEDMAAILARIGGVELTPIEAKEETDGITSRELPTPTDKRYCVK